MKKYERNEKILKKEETGKKKKKKQSPKKSKHQHDYQLVSIKQLT